MSLLFSILIGAAGINILLKKHVLTAQRGPGRSYACYRNPCTGQNLMQKLMLVLLSLTSVYLVLWAVDIDQELIVASFLTGCGGSREEKEELFFCVASVAFCGDPEIHRIFL